MNISTNCKPLQLSSANTLLYKNSILYMYNNTNGKPLNYIDMNAILYNNSIKYFYRNH